MNARPSSLSQLTDPRLGRALSLPRRGGAWRHPWWTQPVWDGANKRWCATVLPGFVNGECPTARLVLEASQKQADENLWGINPLSGEQFFSADIFKQQATEKVTPETTVDVPLYFNPLIELSFRNIGVDGTGDVPQFFINAGVNKPKTQGGDELATPAQAPRGNRLLRAADIVLHQPRTALTSQIEVDPSGFVTGLGIVNQTLGLRVPTGDRLKVYCAAKFEAPQQFVSSADLVAGDYEEAAYDELLVATVYLLSPPDTSLYSAPDATWQGFTRHGLFWNLLHTQPEFRILNSDPGTPFIPPLAGGVAQIAIGYLASSINDMTAQALNILGAHSMAGSFWTPTSGGSDSRFPAQTATDITNYGANKAAKLAAQRAAADAAIRAEQLDPAFPYYTEPFDTGLIA